MAGGGGGGGGGQKLCKNILGKTLIGMDALSHAPVSQRTSSDELAE